MLAKEKRGVCAVGEGGQGMMEPSGTWWRTLGPYVMSVCHADEQWCADLVTLFRVEAGVEDGLDHVAAILDPATGSGPDVNHMPTGWGLLFTRYSISCITIPVGCVGMVASDWK